jgi:hypothetical protein
MITTSRQTPYSYARRVLALPLTAMVLAMLSFTVGNAQSDEKAKVVKKLITDTAGKKEKVVILVTQMDKKTNKPVTIAYSVNDSADLKTMVKRLDSANIIDIKVTPPGDTYKNPKEVKTFKPVIEKKDTLEKTIPEKIKLQTLIDQKKMEDSKEQAILSKLIENRTKLFDSTTNEKDSAGLILDRKKLLAAILSNIAHKQKTAQ